MAGKHYTIGINAVSSRATLDAEVANNRPAYPGTRLDRCYAEGRRAKEAGLTAGANPHASLDPAFSSPEFQSWSAGFTARTNAGNAYVGTQWMTATEDG